MFFAEGRLEKFPREIKEKVEELYNLDRFISQCNKKGINVDLLVIDYLTFSLGLFLRYHKRLIPPLKQYFEEALGEIPIMFFNIDNLRVNKRVKMVVLELVDMSDADSLRHLDREALAKKIYKNLREIRKSFDYDERIDKPKLVKILKKIDMKWKE